VTAGPAAEPAPGNAVDDKVVLDPVQLTEFGARVLASYDVPREDAELVADSLVTADLWGHPSHGMLRLPWYTARLESGVMRARTEPRTVSDLGAVTVLDGQDGVGQVVVDLACRDAVARAARHGVGVVAVRNSNHFGTAAYWTRRMAQAGCVGILTTNGSPAMAPWGGTEKTVGANPWSIATPGGSQTPVVLDIANTGVARGKIYAAAERGEQIPLGWAIDSDGVPATDPHAAIHGLLAPMGGHKGYGISLMMDVLSGVLTGSGYATDIAGPYVPDRPSRCGHLVIALQVDAFMPAEEFAQRIDDLVQITKTVPLAAGTDEIFVPGEIEARAEAKGRAAGVVTLPAKTVSDLDDLGRDRGVELLHRSTTEG
jgi:LDH2 family malate/lactate/ureidoglycolate dehydrogenase